MIQIAIEIILIFFVWLPCHSGHIFKLNDIGIERNPQPNYDATNIKLLMTNSNAYATSDQQLNDSNRIQQ